MSFIESPRFPDDISYGSSGGPAYNTDVITVKSGYETRNQNWVQSRHKYDAAFGIRTEPQLSELIEMFHSMAGKAHEFRYKDWGDYKSCNLAADTSDTDQFLGNGNGVITDFQIVKNYSIGLLTTRAINKPVSNTILVSVNTVAQVEGVDYSVDYTTGIITFNTAPADTLPVYAGYEFDVPCRFDTDELNVNFDAYAIGSVNVPIIEVRI